MSGMSDFFKGLLDPRDLELLQQEHHDDDDGDGVASTDDGRHAHIKRYDYYNHERQASSTLSLSHSAANSSPSVFPPNSYEHQYQQQQYVYQGQHYQEQYNQTNGGVNVEDFPQHQLQQGFHGEVTPPVLTRYDNHSIEKPQAKRPRLPSSRGHTDTGNWTQPMYQSTHAEEFHYPQQQLQQQWHHQQQHPQQQSSNHFGENDSHVKESTPIRHYAKKNSSAVEQGYDDNDCTSIDAIDQRVRDVFQFPFFNKVQSLCLDVVYRTDSNIAVSSPTGSGKTVILELAILHLIEKSLPSPMSNLQQRKHGVHKTIYIGPIKALCQEKTQDWTKRFGALGITCRELTGDTDHVAYQQLRNADIILTTPEKWDSFTRSWKRPGAMQEIIGSLALLLIDEVHILNDGRGATLEAVVSRMKTIKNHPNMTSKPVSQLRFVALSATIPNIEDVAEWLSVPQEGMIVCGDEYRPVKLDTHVVGFKMGKNDFMFDKFLDFKLSNIIASHNNGKPALVFCPTRKSVQNAAQQLVKDADIGRNPYIRDAQHRMQLSSASQTVNDRSLRECISRGIGFHHAGLSYQDRLLVEKLFLDGMTMVICTTSTLAQGVNLPAHLVVVKGTKQYKNSAYVDYGELAVLQMIGRAGRPQFDTNGTAVIMTSQNDVHRYKNLITRKQLVESQLHKNTIEHLNAEIVSETICDVVGAVKWIQGTFLYIRMRKNPRQYNMPTQVDEKVKDVLLSQLNELAQYEMIEFLGEDHFSLRCTPIGRSMAKYYTSFETMKLFCMLDKQSKMEDLLMALSGSKELQECILRRGEKTLLNELNKDTNRIRWPLKGGRSAVKSIAHKVYLLVQNELSDSDKTLDDFNLKQNVNHIFQVISRLCRCLCECMKERKFFDGISQAMLLEKCLYQRMWEDTRFQCRQLEGIGRVLSASLEKAGAGNLEALLTLGPRRIESICNKKPPFGNKTQEAVLSTPWYHVHVSQLGGVKLDAAKEQYVELQIEAKRRTFLDRSGRPYNMPRHRKSLCSVLVGNANGDLLELKKFQAASTNQYSTTVRVTNIASMGSDSQINIMLRGEHFVGVDTAYKLTVTGFTTKKQKGTPQSKLLKSTPMSFDKMVQQTMNGNDESRNEVHHVKSPKGMMKKNKSPVKKASTSKANKTKENPDAKTGKKRSYPSTSKPIHNETHLRTSTPHSSVNAWNRRASISPQTTAPSSKLGTSHPMNHYPQQWKIPPADTMQQTMSNPNTSTVSNNLNAMISCYLNRMQSPQLQQKRQSSMTESSTQSRVFPMGDDVVSPLMTTGPLCQNGNTGPPQDTTGTHRARFDPQKHQPPQYNKVIDLTQEDNDPVHRGFNVPTRTQPPPPQNMTSQGTFTEGPNIDMDLANASSLDELLKDFA